MPNLFLGIDLGGTNIKVGLTNSTGKILHQASISTGNSSADLAMAPVIKRMVEIANDVIQKSGAARRDVVAIGIGSPGQVDLDRGLIIRSANFPLWKNVPLRARFSKGMGIPAILENDAKVAAFGEWWGGGGGGKAHKHSAKTQKNDTFCMMTLGTGVGGAIIYDGKILHGDSGFAGEIGHAVVVPGGDLCGCGQRGCLERYCSAKFVAQRALAAIGKSTQGKKSSLNKVLKQTGALTAVEIAAHAMAGDPFAAESWDYACQLLALACINLCRTIDPTLILLGGGMSKAGNFLLSNVQHHFRRQWWKMTPPTATIALAKLGNDAGLIGAAGVAKQAHDHHALPKIGR